MVYEKVKAWAALLVGGYLIFQCVAMVVGGGVFSADPDSVAFGVPLIVGGLVFVYFAYRLASWGWRNI